MKDESNGIEGNSANKKISKQKLKTYLIDLQYQLERETKADSEKETENSIVIITIKESMLRAIDIIFDKIESGELDA